MFRRFHFFNRYGNGDILNSKEYVRELAQRLPAEEVWYLHPKNPRILEDMDDLIKQGKVTKECNNAMAFIRDGDDIYFNTWIGRDGSYVLPGITCTDIMNRKMFNDILQSMGLDIRLEKPFIEYVPRIDFTRLSPTYINRIDTFLEENTGLKTLICNGDVQSNQATNFDFGPIIERLCARHPDEIFIATGEFKATRAYNNLFFTSQIIRADDRFDLNEIAYLSRGVPLTIGRASGPSVFAQHRENILDASKRFLVFSNHPNCVTFLKGAKGKARFFWSGETSQDGVYEEIREMVEWKT